MKRLLSSASFLALLLLTFSALAQTPPEAPPSERLRITSREVSAVQAELGRRGYYRAEVTGILDKETRAALLKYQAEQELMATGQIDRPTLDHLGIQYPATGKEADSTRRNGILPKVGYAVKDGAIDAGKTVGGAAKAGVEKGKEGVGKTVELAGDAVEKTEEATQDLGEAAAKKAKQAGRGTRRAARRASTAVIGRSDAEIGRDVREVLAADPQTASLRSEVKAGTVTLIAESHPEADLSSTITKIRKVEGVQSVMVVYQ